MKLNALKIVSGIGLILIFIYLMSVVGTSEKVRPQKEDEIKTQFLEYALFFTLFKRLGYDVRHWYSDKPPPSGSVIVIFDYKKESDGLERLIQWVDKGNVAFLFGAEETYLIDDIYFPEGDMEGKFSVAASLGSNVKEISFQTSRFLKIFDRDCESLLTGENGDLLKKVIYGKGAIYVLSDSGFLKTDSLKKEKHAILINDLLKPFYSSSLYIQKEPLLQKQKGISLFFDPKMTLIFIQLLIVSIIFFLWRGMRVGKPAIYQPEGRREIREHLESIGHLFFKFKSYRCVYDINREYFIFSLSQMMGPGKKTTVSEMKAFIVKHQGGSKNSKDFESSESEQIVSDGDLDSLFKKEKYMGRKTMTSINLKMNKILNHMKKIRTGR